jgi:8-oxo-dGTP pyrophosphatase MutT (NUDIX family)/nicotinamide mononucleotide adenylyltransferase
MSKETITSYFEPMKRWHAAGAKIVFWPGRTRPPHKGHVAFLKALWQKGYKLLIGNGSCYTFNPSNPLHVFQVEVMLGQSLRSAGIPVEDFLFVQIPDFEADDDWARYIADIPNFDLVTAIATDNDWVVKALASFTTDEREILKRTDVIAAADLIDISATKLRDALVRNDWKTWYASAASGTIDFLNQAGDPALIRNAILGNETRFNPGRQCVDLVLFVSNGFEWFVLVGNRRSDKADYPNALALPGGGIENYENPPRAAIRELGEETGVRATILAPFTMPFGIELEGKIASLHFIGMYASRDELLAGSKGGSSLCFMTVFDGGRRELEQLLRGRSDLVHVRLVRVAEARARGLAFEQTTMLRDAFERLKAVRGQ